MTAQEIIELLEAHSGTATEWCAICPDYQPTRDELDTIESLADELKVRQRHQAEVLEELIREDRYHAWRQGWNDSHYQHTLHNDRNGREHPVIGQSNPYRKKSIITGTEEKK